MKILVLNGSPRPQGHTAAMVEAFAWGAEEAGHEVTVIDVCKKKIAGCLACEYCHTKGNGKCIQNDDMQEIYPLLESSEMIVFASPVYYQGFTAQLQCAIHRIYALDKPKGLKKTAMILSSGAPDVYDGIFFEYKKSFLIYLGLEDMGVVTQCSADNFEAKLQEAKALGQSLK
ncbi:MAG: flavodoxin family protein [Peptococcaceae bacterium]|nr:flavodoxin family protein [Peptococcaceae bacterium]